MPLEEMLLIVCPLVFFASFVDAIAGGGGLISLPAYMLTGMPAHLAIGSNKMSAAIGTLVSTIRFPEPAAVQFSPFRKLPRCMPVFRVFPGAKHRSG